MTSAERVGSAASASDDGRRSGGGRGERVVRFVGGGQLVHQLLCFQHQHGAKFGSSLVPYI